jgi:hypothetical protein
MMRFSISYSDLIKFPHFMVFEGERMPKDKVTLWITLIYTLILTHPKTFTEGRVNVFDKYLHWLGVNVKEIIYTSTVEV